MLRLRQLRKQCDLTMKEFGSRFGLAESTISQYETGKRQPDYEQLLKFSEYFGVSVDYLLGNETEKKNPLPTAGNELSERKRIMIEKILTLSDDQIDLLDRLADAVLDHKTD